MAKAIVSASAEVRSLVGVARSCIFCGGGQMTLEHVWPSWAAKLVAHAGAVQHRSYVEFQGRDAVAKTYDQPPFQQTAKVVCRHCTSGARGSPIVKALVLGSARSTPVGRGCERCAGDRERVIVRRCRGEPSLGSCESGESLRVARYARHIATAIRDRSAFGFIQPGERLRA